jgi:hypothetical protein
MYLTNLPESINLMGSISPSPMMEVVICLPRVFLMLPMYFWKKEMTDCSLQNAGDWVIRNHPIRKELCKTLHSDDNI